MRPPPRTQIHRRLPDVDEPHEIWRSIAGFEGFYEVSNRGRVRSLDRTVASDSERRDAVSHRRGSVDLVPTPDRNGRLNVTLSRDGVNHHRGVATLVLDALVGAKPPSCVVGHHDGDKGHCASENLFWRTRGDVIRSRRLRAGKS